MRARLRRLLDGEDLSGWFGPEDVRPLINAVVSPAELMPKATALAARLARHPNQQALRAAKKLLHERERAALAAVLDEENAAILEALTSDDFRRTLKAAQARAKAKKAKGTAAQAQPKARL